MAIDAPVHVNEINLPRVLGAGAPAVLVFWKRDCAPCSQLQPVLETLARRYAGKALIANINIADEPGLARRYSISQLPTLIFTRAGEEVARGVGAAAEREIGAWLEYLVNGGARPPLFAGPSLPVHSPTAAAQAGPTRPATEGQATAGQANAGAAQQGARTSPLVLNDGNFAQVIRESTVPVLVDFWAEWCGPCKMIAPHVAALAQEFAGRALVAKMNVDENPRTAGQFGVMSIPTLLIFSGGRVVDQIVGAQPGHVLRQRLARHAK